MTVIAVTKERRGGETRVAATPETVKKLDYEANKIVWLSPSSANNTWAIALRQDVTDENKLKTLSDFGKFVSEGGKVVLAASSEFVNSAAALPAFLLRGAASGLRRGLLRDRSMSP